MAKNLLEKINLLIRANIGGLSIRGSKPSAENLHKQIDLITADEALIMQKLAALDQELLDMDEQADQLVAAGRDARYLIEKIQLAKQRRAMLASELENHRTTLAELTRHASHFESVKVEKQQAQIQKSEPKKITLLEEAPAEEENQEDISIRRSRLAKPDGS